MPSHASNPWLANSCAEYRWITRSQNIDTWFNDIKNHQKPNNSLVMLWMKIRDGNWSQLSVTIFDQFIRIYSTLPSNRPYDLWSFIWLLLSDILQFYSGNNCTTLTQKTLRTTLDGGGLDSFNPFEGTDFSGKNNLNQFEHQVSRSQCYFTCL